MIAAKSTPILLSCLKILPETHHLAVLFEDIAGNPPSAV